MSIQVNINNLQKINKKYKQNNPFPHIVLENFFEISFLEKVRQEVEVFSDWDGEKNFYGSEKKRWQNDIDKLPKNVSKLISYINSPSFLEIIEEITGESNLIPDPYLEGGGIHSTGNQGFLKMHVDFNWHEKLQAFRRLNVLIYLNKDWDKSFGGNLLLAKKNIHGKLDVKQSIEPLFNRVVIFTTDDQSFHGQPDVLSVPESIRRNSIAAYYYVTNNPQNKTSKKRVGTNYVNLKGKNLKYQSIFRKFLKNFKR